MSMVYISKLNFYLSRTELEVGFGTPWKNAVNKVFFTMHCKRMSEIE